MPATRTTSQKRVAFSRKLALHRWFLGLFGHENLDELAKHLKGEELSGLTADNVHRFHEALRLHVPSERRPDVPDDRLLEADQRIVAVTQRLNETRTRHGQRPIRWLYFQYLALLATDIYLDLWFSDPKRLRTELETAIEFLNRERQKRDRIEPFAHAQEPVSAEPQHGVVTGAVTDQDAVNQLNKLCFWMATGSGKTLLMHAHILLFQKFLRKHERQHELNRIILLTPNEGLSRQHLDEFEVAGIAARPFERNVLPGAWVEVLDVHKLHDEMGEKRVAVSAFEGNNLVLVDEGHRGASSGEQGQWMRRRDELCERGFSFEYSATFGQAVDKDRKLTNTYARSILFDYSYRWFHGDGYGKDYRIFNLEGQHDDDWQQRYLTAALLTFFQQQWLHGHNSKALRAWAIERPLWVFVGSRVTKGLNKDDASDVVRIIQFLDHYTQNRSASTANIRTLLEQGLATTGGRNLFADHFARLQNSGMSAEHIFGETLSTTFNAPGGGSLRVERLKGTGGELALRLGENEPFGVINVGDGAKLAKRCGDARIDVTERLFSGSAFHHVNDPDSSIHLVVGARKFTEGWNSWRVSSMSLMNVGKSEGAQIIQMFGRGVRLKGRDMSLKRSSASPELAREAPAALRYLETLQVFGIRANYMAQFRDFLEREGAAVDRETFFLPVHRRTLPGDAPLRTIGLADDVAGAEPEAAFRRRGPMPVLCPPDQTPCAIRKRLRPAVRLDWNPRVRTLASDAGTEVITKSEARLTHDHIPFLDQDALFFDLVRFKTKRGWHNLTISRAAIRQLLSDSSWYRLLAPAPLFEHDNGANVRHWREIAGALLRKYAARYYSLCRHAWEACHLEIRPLDDDDPNLQVMGKGGGGNGFFIELASSGSASDLDALKASLAKLQTAIDSPDFPDWDEHQVKALRLDEHLYWPLLSVENDRLTVSPPALNEGEFRFVRDLQKFLKQEQRSVAGVRIYLMRNQSRGRGIGFFEANNFHPDFILWAIKNGCQHIAFVDPKGLMHLSGPDDPKILLRKTIKDVEKQLQASEDSRVRLESFIVSVTPFEALDERWKDGGRRLSRDHLAELHVLFQDDPGYVRSLFLRLGVL